MYNKDYFKEYYNKNKNKLKKYYIQYYKNNRQKIISNSCKWAKENPKKMKINREKYRNSHKEQVKKSARIYYLKHIDKIQIYRKKYMHTYRKSHKIQINKKRREYNYKKYRTDKAYKIKALFRSRVLKHFKKIKSNKKCSFSKSKYDINKVIRILETQFDDNMSWDNYSKYWDLGHRIPLSWFDTNEDLINIGWNINNLFPVEAYWNRYVQRNKFAFIDNMRFYNRQEAILYFKNKYINNTKKNNINPFKV